jgi:hypothetical protein
MINGRAFDWESIRIDAPWGLDVRILSINYSSDRPVDPVYGRGNVPRGYGRGNLVQDGTIIVDAQAWIALTVFAATQGGILRVKPFPISVSYANGDQIPQNDLLPSVVFSKVEKGAAQGDTEIAKHTLTIKILDPIRYNLIPVA